jgi:hypothetical protein
MNDAADVYHSGKASDDGVVEGGLAQVGLVEGGGSGGPLLLTPGRSHLTLGGLHSPRLGSLSPAGSRLRLTPSHLIRHLLEPACPSSH